MKIVLEGCDGVGKTSIAKILAERYGLDIVHMTSDDPKDFLFYDQSLRKENVIYDRNVIGERVYPHVFKRPFELLDSELTAIIDRHKDVHFFVITADDEEIRRRLHSRGYENDKIVENIELINTKFKLLAVINDIPVIDTTIIDATDAAQQIINIIEKEK